MMWPINLLCSYFTEKNEEKRMLIKKRGTLAYRLVFYPLYLLFLLPFLAKGQWMYKMLYILILWFPILSETMGRYLLVSGESIIQRIGFIKRQEIYINDIKYCYINDEKLIIETEKFIMNINMLYYRKKDLKLLCEKAGFPEVVIC